MDKIIVNGGRRLSGEVRISGAKNAALPILISSLLTDGANTYLNVPQLRDIDSTKLLLSNLGACIETEADRVQIDASGLNNHEAPYDLVRKMRASILVLGPLVARLRTGCPGCKHRAGPRVC
jgi:UDP-N-acetylglucosamine 1-carboxyvinyltransferase